MSTFVRAQADTDTDDAPDSTLQVYARAAYDDIKRRVFPWPDKLITTTFTTVPGTAYYAFTGFTVGTLEFVTSVSNADNVLAYASPEQVLDWNTPSAINSNTSTFYSVSKTGLTLWPTPSSVETVTVSGYRSFLTWPSGSTEPDLDRGFDVPICWYMLSKFYSAQEDLELAQMYMADYERGVNQQIEAALRTSAVTAGPRIFGGDPDRGDRYVDWMRRNTEG